MAVYERSYKRYQGPLTPAWSRFLVLPRYAWREVFQSRMFVAFFVFCFAAPLAGLILIYLRHNLSALNLFQLSSEEFQKMLPIDSGFFWRGLMNQGFLGFLLVLFVGPALVAPDLRNNGLALYLSRPFSRSEYVIGKMTVLVVLLSAITWVPGLILFLFQGYLEGSSWLSGHWSLAWAIFAGSWAWILPLSLLALAVSAWVKWKPIARVALLGTFFVLSGFGQALNHALDTWWGSLLSVWELIQTVWAGLFEQPNQFEMPVWSAWLMLAVFCSVCLWLLSRRVRAYEVVR